MMYVIEIFTLGGKNHQMKRNERHWRKNTIFRILKMRSNPESAFSLAV